MNSRFVIIAILIFIKIIGIASRAKADDYSSCYSVNKIKYIVQDEDFDNLVFRCGKTTVFKDV